MIDTLQQEPVALPERPFGRTARSVLGYALLVTLMFFTPLFVFVPVALFACGMRNGKVGVTVSLSIAALFSWLVTMQIVHSSSVTPADAAMEYAYLLGQVLAIAIPALVVLPLVERGESFGRVLLTAVLVGITGLAVTEAVMQARFGFSPYQEHLVRGRETAAQAMAMYQKAGVPPDSIHKLSIGFDLALSCLPALFLFTIIIVFVLSLVMFGRLKAWREFMARGANAPAEKPPVMGAYLFRNLSLPDWLLFAFIIGGLTPLASGVLQKVTGNILAVVAFLYLVQGLAIFRSLLVAVGAGLGGVIFSYLILITLLPISTFLLSIAGLFDSFFDFRHFRRKDHSDESHPH